MDFFIKSDCFTKFGNSGFVELVVGSGERDNKAVTYFEHNLGTLLAHSTWNL